MTNQDYAQSNAGNSLMHRRIFLITSGTGVAGLALFPFSSAEASPVVAAVARFAFAVGSSVVTSLITDYIRSKLTPSTAQEVENTNRAMANIQGTRFSDLSRSTVYSPRTENNYFFYPAQATEPGQIINACVAFFDRNRNQGSQRVTLIEGPSLFGIAELAHRVAQNRNDTTAKRTFLPRQGSSIANIRLDRSSNDPDLYSTDAGSVESIYRTSGDGTGEVHVKARSLGGTLLADGRFDLTYRA